MMRTCLAARRETLITILVVAYIAWFLSFSLQRHHAHITAGFDLGNVDQAIWNTLHGRPLGMTTVPGMTTRLGLHFEPILFLIAPFYLIHSGPETLLVLQTVIVALGALPIFWLARDEVGEWPAVGFAAVYLLFPALQAANSFDFHALTLSPTFLGGALWSMRRRRYRLFALFAALAMACKEELPLVVALMGLLILVVNRDRRPGLLTITAAAGWFILANMVVIPALSPAGANIHYDRYPALGQDLGAMVITLVTQPGQVIRVLLDAEKNLTLLRLTMPVAFVALIDPLTLGLLAPVVAVNLLSNHPPMHALDNYHYWVAAVPFVIVAAATGARRLAGLAHRLLRVDRKFVAAVLTGMILFVSLFYHRALGHTPLRADFVWPQVTPHHTLLAEITALIPPGASHSVQNPLAPHVSRRQQLFIFPRLEDAEYVLLDLTAPSSADIVEDRPAYQRAVGELLAADNSVLLVDNDGYLLVYRRPTKE